MRIVKSSERRDRLVSLASNLGSHETDKPPFSKANILAVPKTKVPFTSPIGKEPRIFETSNLPLFFVSLSASLSLSFYFFKNEL
jgi:hypothetical protein